MRPERFRLRSKCSIRATTFPQEARVLQRARPPNATSSQDGDLDGGAPHRFALSCGRPRNSTPLSRSSSWRHTAPPAAELLICLYGLGRPRVPGIARTLIWDARSRKDESDRPRWRRGRCDDTGPARPPRWRAPDCCNERRGSGHRCRQLAALAVPTAMAPARPPEVNSTDLSRGPAARADRKYS